MTALLEKMIAIIAPHHCIKCGIEDNVLCEACASDVFLPILPLCVYCEKPTVDWRVCAKCHKNKKLCSVWVAADYNGVVTELVKMYKFERVKAAYKPLALVLDSLLPYIDPSAIIVPLPTAPARVRERGYDQSVLLARELARLRGLKFAQPVVRLQSTRQVGADRKTRQEQASRAYGLIKPELVKGKQVWLVDDICTTGASLSAAARLLKKTGATEVNAVVVAWQRLEK